MILREFLAACDPALPLWINDDPAPAFYQTRDHVPENEKAAAVEYITIDAAGILTIELKRRWKE